MLLTGVTAFALLAWVVVLVLPWQPHRTRERLEADDASDRDAPADLSDVCVLIPARDEAALIVARSPRCGCKARVSKWS